MPLPLGQSFGLRHKVMGYEKWLICTQTPLLEELDLSTVIQGGENCGHCIDFEIRESYIYFLEGGFQ